MGQGKFVKAVLLALMVVFFLTAAAEAKTVIKCGTSTQPSHIYNVGMEYFAKIVKEKTKGELEVQIFPGAQLGSERDLVEGLQLGSVEMTLTSTGPVGAFVPEVRLFNLPFLFKDRTEAYKILDGPIGEEIAAKFPAKGIRSLGWYENGFRNITNSRNPVNKPEDLKGLKIRVMEDQVFILTMKTMGASPLPMAFGEVYTALEQKTVDAQENPLAVIDSSRFQEVQKYLALTGHFYSPSMLLVSEQFFQKLSKEHQAVLIEAGKQARDYERNLSLEADQKLEAKLTKDGMQVTKPAKEPFIEVVKTVYLNPDVLKLIGGGDAAKGEALVKKTLAALGR